KGTAVTVFDGENGWLKSDGQTRELAGDQLAELKELGNVLRVGRLVPLREGGYELTPLGRAKVNGRPAVGLKVAAPALKDVSLYVDEETGLLAKIERRAFSTAARKEVTEERVHTDYQDVDGVKLARKVTVYHDGKRFSEVEVLEAKTVEKLDDGLFMKP